jgi:ankyrin repeat protein
MLEIPAGDARAVALIQAIRRGDVEALRKQLDESPELARARVVDRGGVSRTLLHVVSGWPGHFQNGARTVATLLAAGADVDAAVLRSDTARPVAGRGTLSSRVARDRLGRDRHWETGGRPMSDYQVHPVGYRGPGPPGDEQRRSQYLRLRRRVMAVMSALFLAALGVVGYFLVMVAGEPPGSDRAAPPATATLDSGQEIVGDFEILSYERVRARGLEKALAVAIESYPEKLRELIEVEGVDPDLRIPHSGGDGWTHPLEKAVRQGTPETLRILLDAGADVNGASSSGDAALHTAAGQGSLEIVEELLRRGADPNRLAVSHDHAEQRKRMEELGQKWEPHTGAAPIERAAGRGHREVVSRLLDAGARPRYALLAAGSAGDVELIEQLLEKGADPRAVTGYRESTLRHAATKGHVAAVKRLLAAGARPGEMALRGAAQNGHDDVIRAFAEAGVRFDGPPGYWDPLYSAAHAGLVSTVALLLELGAATAAAEGQDRPIDAARAQGHADVVALLEGR